MAGSEQYPRRRDFLRWTAALGAAGVASALMPGRSGAQAAGAASRPNIILIVADDLGHGDLGCYGQTKIRTPRLDAMAAEGLLFAAAYAGSAVCAPSRSCLLTGQHTGHTPVRGNPPSAVGWDRRALGDVALPADAPNFARALQAAGYATACIGKWGLGKAGTSGDPLKQGFDYHYGYISHSSAHNYYPDALFRNNEEHPLRPDEYSHDALTADALRWVGEQAAADEPFMLYFAPTLPHIKLDPPDLEPYADTDWKQTDKAYAAMVTRLDISVGQLIDLVREKGIERSTLVLFTSDNGTHNAGGRQPDFLNSNVSLRGVKRDLYEGGIRVPLLAWWPGTIAAGTSDHLTANWDLFPTFTELAGLEAPGGIDGVSLAPTLRGQADRQQRHGYLYWEFVEQGGKQAVRRGRYKAVRLNVSRNADAPIELYDLENDPSEKTNIAQQHPQIVQQMRQLVEEAHTPSKMFPLLPAELAAKTG